MKFKIFLFILSILLIIAWAVVHMQSKFIPALENPRIAEVKVTDGGQSVSIILKDDKGIVFEFGKIKKLDSVSFKTEPFYIKSVSTRYEFVKNYLLADQLFESIKEWNVLSFGDKTCNTVIAEIKHRHIRLKESRNEMLPNFPPKKVKY